MDEPISRLLIEDCRSYRKHHDRSHCVIHRFQEWDFYRIQPVSYASRIHPDRRNSLCTHFRIFLSADAGYRGRKVDVHLSAGLRIPAILSSVPRGKMPCGFCLVNSHFYNIACSSRCSFIAAVRSCDTTRGHTPIDLAVRSRSHREHLCFDGTGVLVRSIRDFRV